MVKLLGTNDIKAKFFVFYRNNLSALLDNPELEKSFPLHPPTGKFALTNQVKVRDWIREWEEVDWASVAFETRDWSSVGLGHQLVPARVTIAGAQCIAEVVGCAEDWSELLAKFQLLRAHLPVERIHQHLTTWRKYSLDECELAITLVRWLTENPDSGLAPRAVPLTGMHSKWVEKHRGLITALYGSPELGLQLSHPQRISFKILDPTLRLHPRLRDLSCPADQCAAAFASPPQHIAMVENQETFEAFPDFPEGSGVIAIWGHGYQAISMMKVPEIQQAIVWYFGDLDTDGFAILSALREHHDAVHSVLMDAETVQKWKCMAVHDRPYSARNFRNLTPEETEALDQIIVEGLRIEQERIIFSEVIDAFSAAVLRHDHEA